MTPARAVYITSRLKTSYMFILMLIIFSTVTFPLFAKQNHDDDSTHHSTSVYKDVNLVFGGGFQYGIYRDNGVAPFCFKGLSVAPSFGLTYGDSYHTRFSITSTTSIGIYEDELPPLLNFSAYDIHNTISVNLLFPIKKCVKDLWIGGAITNFMDIAVNPNYENASVGISEFLGPEIVARLYQCPPTNRNAIIFHEELRLMPFAAVLRPGYAYIDNYTSRQPVLAALFDDYEWSMKFLAGIATDIGFDIKTGRGNRICVSYRWCYYSSGNSGQWRFDHATHLINIDFVFNLRSRT